VTAPAEGPATVTLTDCPCGHSIERHGEWGCAAYVPPKIGGSPTCCTRTPAEVFAARVDALTADLAAAEQARDDWHDTAQKTASECGRQRARADEAERAIANVRALADEYGEYNPGHGSYMAAAHRLRALLPAAPTEEQS
jgi:hypothetical protein